MSDVRLSHLRHPGLDATAALQSMAAGSTHIFGSIPGRLAMSPRWRLRGHRWIRVTDDVVKLVSGLCLASIAPAALRRSSRARL
jgi:hypothetical protein